MATPWRNLSLRQLSETFRHGNLNLAKAFANRIATVITSDFAVLRLRRIAENNCALWSDRLITRERDGYVAVTAPRDEPNGTTRSYFR